MDYRKAAWAVLFAALAVGGASAATTDTTASVATRIGDCGKLPLSERGICKEQVLASTAAPATLAEPRAPAGESASQACSRLPLSERGICSVERRAAGAPAPTVTADQRRMLQSENDRYRTKLAQCSRMPLSERNTCISDAGSPEALEGKG